MISLQQGDLKVELLDPANPAEQARQGLRYCWGGYIWRVIDARAGDLCAGPEWPGAAPSAYNGQGLPESFRHREFGTNRPLTFNDAGGLVPGVGRVAVNAKGEPELVEPAVWEVATSPARGVFRTEQTGLGWTLRLQRTIELQGRTLTSATEIVNASGAPFPLHWFAHPFFALSAGRIAGTFAAGWGLAVNPGFALDRQGRLTQHRVFDGLNDGHFEPMLVPEVQPLQVRLAHPRIEWIDFSTDFAPSMCPMWGNGNTWSVEPYLVTQLAPGDSRAWTLRYHFGAVV
jgi:hypothetical protein